MKSPIAFAVLANVFYILFLVVLGFCLGFLGALLFGETFAALASGFLGLILTLVMGIVSWVLTLFAMLELFSIKGNELRRALKLTVILYAALVVLFLVGDVFLKGGTGLLADLMMGFIGASLILNAERFRRA